MEHEIDSNKMFFCPILSDFTPVTKSNRNETNNKILNKNPPVNTPKRSIKYIII